MSVVVFVVGPSWDFPQIAKSVPANVLDPFEG